MKFQLQNALFNAKQITVAPVNAATVVKASSEPSFRADLDIMDILIPDGYWLKVAAWLLRYPPVNHIPTVRLTYWLLRRLATSGGRLYILGAKDNIVLKAANEVTYRFSGIKIVGAQNGYFSNSEEYDVVKEINNAKPHLLLIGISSPKRELFIARNHKKFNVPVIIGVGGFIDILGGKTAEGPDWLRNFGLMWVYRFMKEPKRLWKRYTITNFKFIWLVLKQALNTNLTLGRKNPR